MFSGSVFGGCFANEVGEKNRGVREIDLIQRLDKGKGRQCKKWFGGRGGGEAAMKIRHKKKTGVDFKRKKKSKG